MPNETTSWPSLLSMTMEGEGVGTERVRLQHLMQTVPVAQGGLRGAPRSTFMNYTRSHALRPRSPGSLMRSTFAVLAVFAGLTGCGGDPPATTSPDGTWFCGGSAQGLCHEWQGLSSPNDDVRAFCRNIPIAPGRCQPSGSLGACVSPSALGVTRYWWWYRYNGAADWPSTPEAVRDLCGTRETYLPAP